MRDLLRLTDEELAEISLKQELRVMTSFVLATVSGGLALAGMMARFSPEDKTPLPGMNHLAGQLGWAALLVVLLGLAAWLVRGVVMKRLQWAIAISLVVHLLLCATFHSFSLHAPLSQHPQGEDSQQAVLTLPDYGALETPAESEAVWEQPTDADAPESVLEVQRQATEVARPERTETEEIERSQEIAKVDSPERQEQAAFEKEIQQEIERRKREQEMQTPQVVDQPNVKTSQAARANFEAQVEQSKSQSAALSAHREQSDVASKDPSLEAAKMQSQRSEPQLLTNDDPTDSQARAEADAEAADAAAENVDVSTAEANFASALELPLEADRQQAANAPDSERSMSDAPELSLNSNVDSVRPDRVSGVDTPADATPTAGGATSLARSESGGGQSGSAAGAEAQAVAVGAAGGVDAPRVSESSATNSATRGSAATVPLGTGGQRTGAALAIASAATPTRGSGRMSRQTGGAGQPQLGQSEGGRLATGSSTGRQSGAVGAEVGEVAVGVAGGVNAPRVSESSAANAATRGSAATVPLGTASQGTGTAQASAPTASPTRGSGKMSRQTGGSGQPQLGQSEGGKLTSGSGTGRQSGVVGAEAGEVAVGAAGGVNAPRVSESSAVNGTPRGSAATVPLGTGGQGTGSALASASTATPTRGSGSLSRQTGGAGQPQLGQSEGGKLASGSGTGRQAGAVGAEAGEVAVSGASGRSSNSGGTLASGPAKTSVGRKTTSLAGGGTSGPSRSPTTSTSGSSRGPATATRSTGSAGLASRGTEPNARLGASLGAAEGSAASMSTARSGVSAKLPAGSEGAEQSGALVFAGPQAQAGGAGSLAGPQMGSSVPRRSAGLPGSTSSGVSVPVASTANSQSAQPARLTGGPSRPGLGESRPTLSSETEVAVLIKKSVPGIGASPDAKISESLAMRKPESRREATKALGGSEASEDAVERGLVWLAQHQHADGHWSIDEFQCQDHACTGHGSFHSDTAATGLALLAFLGAGYTHQSGQHQAVVERAVKWHLEHQKADGDLFADESEFVWFYSHGMATIALCEAYGLTKDPELRDPAQRAIDFIVAGQHPEFGGWRYRPKFESDTSVSGWQLMAFKSGEMGGLNVPKSAYAGVARWLDSVESQTSPGQFAYHPSRPASVAMSAEGLLMRQYLGAKRDDADLIAGAEFLRKNLPDLDQRDAYYWYYGTQVMFHMQGVYWEEWNAHLRDTLVNSQLKDGGSSGSWNPDRPTPEKWGAAGGRHYVTCLNLLMLEVYYRHLPLYIELGK